MAYIKNPLKALYSLSLIDIYYSQLDAYADQAQDQMPRLPNKEQSVQECDATKAK